MSENESPEEKLNRLCMEAVACVGWTVLDEDESERIITSVSPSGNALIVVYSDGGSFKVYPAHFSSDTSFVDYIQEVYSIELIPPVQNEQQPDEVKSTPEETVPGHKVWQVLQQIYTGEEWDIYASIRAHELRLKAGRGNYTNIEATIKKAMWYEDSRKGNNDK